MRSLILHVLLCISVPALCQQPDFTVHNLSLPPELSFYDNQFSGLYIHEGKLFLMSESRLQDKAEAKLYAINLTDLDRKILDTAFSLPFKKYHIYNLDLLREKMKQNGDEYEGLEAIVINGNDVYLTPETETASPNCYLLKGHLNYTNLVMDPDVMMPLKKPVNRNGSHIYNAGFEALGMIDGNLYSFYEYNFFPEDNYVKMISPASLEKGGQHHSIYLDKIPFRVTDITPNGSGFTAINYFYKGGGYDAVYRVPKNQTSADRLSKDSLGVYRNYSRLIDISFNGMQFSWKTLWEFPEEYHSYNWEGLAAYNKGYFLINDKYTPTKPYVTRLLYFKPKN
ncbi:MAG: hypothetical protein WKF88_00310 [Ferruginibacter sp.]